jgi:hypothetical protein
MASILVLAALAALPGDTDPVDRPATVRLTRRSFAGEWQGTIQHRWHTYALRLNAAGEARWEKPGVPVHRASMSIEADGPGRARVHWQWTEYLSFGRCSASFPCGGVFRGIYKEKGDGFILCLGWPAGSPAPRSFQVSDNTFLITLKRAKPPQLGPAAAGGGARPLAAPGRSQ